MVSEGVNDPGIFKAIFLAGGPGSGKSYVASNLFGIPEKINVSPYGLKIVKNTPMEIKSNCHNDFYLKTKRDKLGHKLFKLNG